MCKATTGLKQGKSQSFPLFNSIKIEDRAFIQGFIDQYQPLSCEYSFANLYSWQGAHNTSWSIYKKRLVFYDGINRCSFLPLGKKMTPKELVHFSLDMKGAGMSSDIGVVTSHYLEEYPEIEQFYTISDGRDSAEYLYSVAALCDLKGPKLHKKKNLISQFHRKNPNSSVKKLSGKFRTQAKILADEIYNGHERFLRGIENEHTALLKSLDDFEEIGLDGLVLLVGNDLIAFSVFSPLPHDTYDIHFEKACQKFKGAAQVINHETAKYLREKCNYLNREQDLGIPGLRQAKMTYEPESLLNIHTLIFNYTC